MGASNDGSHLASSLGNSIVKRRKSWILRMCCNQSQQGQSLLDILISLRDVWWFFNASTFIRLLSVVSRINLLEARPIPTHCRTVPRLISVWIVWGAFPSREAISLFDFPSFFHRSIKRRLWIVKYFAFVVQWFCISVPFLCLWLNSKYNTELFSYAYKSFHVTRGPLEAVLSAKARLVLSLDASLTSSSLLSNEIEY